MKLKGTGLDQFFDIVGQSIIPRTNGKFCEGEIITINRKRIGRREPGM